MSKGQWSNCDNYLSQVDTQSHAILSTSYEGIWTNISVRLHDTCRPIRECILKCNQIWSITLSSTPNNSQYLNNSFKSCNPSMALFCWDSFSSVSSVSNNCWLPSRVKQSHKLRSTFVTISQYNRHNPNYTFNLLWRYLNNLLTESSVFIKTQLQL